MKPRASTNAILTALGMISPAFAATWSATTGGDWITAANWGGASWASPDSDTDTNVITVSAANAAVGKLFGRLKAVKNP